MRRRRHFAKPAPKCNSSDRGIAASLNRREFVARMALGSARENFSSHSRALKMNALRCEFEIRKNKGQFLPRASEDFTAPPICASATDAGRWRTI
jgi:hypothetical protein